MGGRYAILQNLPSLERIDLTGCNHLIECPNLDGSPNLKSIRLLLCKSLLDVHPSIFSLPKIEKLVVSHCKALKRLCSDYCSPSLRHLLAFGCSNLEEFSVPIVAHRSKIILYLSSTALSEVPPIILHLKNVDYFSFNISYSLEKLPSNFATTIVLTDPEKREDDTCIVLSRILPTPAFLSLKKLCFFNCKSLSKLPDNIDVLQSLQLLSVIKCLIISLPERIKNLRQLMALDILHCVKLQYLPPLPSSIEVFRTMECKSLETISSLTSKLPCRKHGVMFRFYNSMNLDKHAYDAVLKDLKSRMALGSSNYAKDGNLFYCIPCKSDMPNDCHPYYHSIKASLVTVEVPPDCWISSGLVFYLHLSQNQSCILDLKDAIFGSECYLKKSCNEWERIASSCNQEWFGAPMNHNIFPFKLKSDHMALWYDAKCCSTIREAIKEGKSGTACNPIFKFVFYAQTKDNVELVTNGCGIRWMHLDFVKDKGKSNQDVESNSPYRICLIRNNFSAVRLGKLLTLQRWSKPPSRWMKMNVNWSIDPQNSRGGCGGVIRDNHGFWIRGFTAPIAVADNNKILGELIAIKMGLELAWSMQVPRLICGSDCYKALKLCMNPKRNKMILHKNPASSTALSVLYDIYELLQRKWTVEFFWLPRNENWNANDMAAKAAKDQTLGAFVWDLPPPDLSHLLKRSSCSDKIVIQGDLKSGEAGILL
ncbi:hypothetical protein PIB30_035428, partial [Stylosanthes scabra]|nr:hypothetical protein [Stylosanthes scabra]